MCINDDDDETGQRDKRDTKNCSHFVRNGAALTLTPRKRQRARVRKRERGPFSLLKFGSQLRTASMVAGYLLIKAKLTRLVNVKSN